MIKDQQNLFSNKLIIFRDNIEVENYEKIGANDSETFQLFASAAGILSIKNLFLFF